ncbi:hypothetical protein [Schinkia azotoformans]|uniref:hypothetical protein n=1 Tax=Schinkia azotoformans TaxID=1454 RepID=UPI002DB8577A|nr:hypothetical protein [Schinkia azotoformans]MEC1780089.1 hypothetical protein [Schinkia azotoformans]MED4330832.1 hypothetical protein [Schinkia azotoformans]
MSLSQRDKNIINDIRKFRVMDTNSIAELHFNNCKNPSSSACNVLLRLMRLGHIKRLRGYSPYLYMLNESKMKQDSNKIPHFLELLNVYKEIRSIEEPRIFQVESRYEQVRPDIFSIFLKTPFFIEVQRSTYSYDEMEKKLKRYEELFQSGLIAGENWQPKDRVVFPHLLIILDSRYNFKNDYSFKIFQASSVTEFIDTIRPQQENKQVYRSENGAIKIKL